MGNHSETLGWPQCGEIDFMEQVNGASASPNPSDHSQYGTFHYNQGGEAVAASVALQSGGIVTNASAMWGSTWHVYAFEWTATTISFSVDNATYFLDSITSVDTNSFTDPTNPFYFLVNLAFGGNFPNENPDPLTLPAALYVDWIRLWQKPDGVQYLVAPNAAPAPPAATKSSSSSTGVGKSSSGASGHSSIAGTSTVARSTGTSAAGAISAGSSAGSSSGGAEESSGSSGSSSSSADLSSVTAATGEKKASSSGRHSSAVGGWTVVMAVGVLLWLAH